MAKNQKVFLSYIIIFLGLVTVWYLWFYPQLETIKSNYLLFILIWFIGKTLIWILPVFIYLKVIGIKDYRGFLKLTNNWTKGIGWGLILGLLWVLLRLILFRFILGDKTITPQMEPFLWIATSLSGPFEEIPFRGLILQQLNEHMSFRKANALSALLFLIYHLPTWSVTGFKNLVPNCLIVLLLGLGWGFVLKKTKSIWAPAIFHTVHNLSVQIGIG